MVPGDILLLEGQRFSLPCDAILLEGGCVVNEGMLTGTESPPPRPPSSALAWLFLLLTPLSTVKQQGPILPCSGRVWHGSLAVNEAEPP